jgi:hypothetical protein
MNRNKLYIDVLIIILIGFLLSLSFFQHFTVGFSLTINFYLGVVWWLTTILIYIKKSERGKKHILILLIFSCFNIIEFYYANISFGSSNIYKYKEIYFSLPGLNPFSLLMLISYIFLNLSMVKQFYRNLLGHNDAEIEQEDKKQFKFYYENFIACNSEELEYAIKNINEYPEQALEALKIVVEKRGSFKILTKTTIKEQY